MLVFDDGKFFWAFIQNPICFLMPSFSDIENMISFFYKCTSFSVDFLNKRTGRVHPLYFSLSEVFIVGGSCPVSWYDDSTLFGDFWYIFFENHSFPLKHLDDKFVMDDFVIDIDWCWIVCYNFHKHFDSSVYSGTISSRKYSIYLKVHILRFYMQFFASFSNLFSEYFWGFDGILSDLDIIVIDDGWSFFTSSLTETGFYRDVVLFVPIKCLISLQPFLDKFGKPLTARASCTDFYIYKWHVVKYREKSSFGKRKTPIFWREFFVFPMVPKGGLGRSSGRDPPLLIDWKCHSRHFQKPIRIQVPSTQK